METTWTVRRFLSPALAQAFLQTEKPTLTPELPQDISCFRLLLPKGTLFSEEGPEIRSVVVADVRARTEAAGREPDEVEATACVYVQVPGGVGRTMGDPSMAERVRPITGTPAQIGRASCRERV